MSIRHRVVASACSPNVLPGVALFLVAASSAALFAAQASDPYVIDEAEFPLVAEGVATTGEPVYYRGDLAPANIGIWHPPMYVYSLGAWQIVFGSSHFASRSFGFGCLLAAAALGWFILQRLFPLAGPWLAVGWAAIFLLHPYAIQSALLPDIDSTVLVLFTAILMWCATEFVLARRWSLDVGTAVLGGALGLALLSKLTTPIALAPLAVYAIAERTRSTLATFVRTGIALLIAVAVLLSAWGILSAVVGLSFSYPFRFTLDSFDSKAGDVGLGERFASLWPADVTLFWIGTPFLLLFLVGLVASVVTMRSAASRMCVAFGVVALAVFLTYNVITAAPFGFPKYYAPALLPMSLVAVAPFGIWGASLRDSLAARVDRRLAYLALAAALLAGVLLAAVQYGRNRTVTVQPERPMWFVAALAVTFLAVVLVAWRLRSDGPRLLALGLLVWLSCAASVLAIGVSASLQQRSDPASVRYFPGEHDLSLASAEARRLIDALPPEQRSAAVMISAKDVGYESQRAYVEDGWYLADPALLAAWFEQRPGAMMVTRAAGDFSEPVWPEAFAALRLVAQPLWVSPRGDFTIWVRSDQARRR